MDSHLSTSGSDPIHGVLAEQGMLQVLQGETNQQSHHVESVSSNISLCSDCHRILCVSSSVRE